MASLGGAGLALSAGNSLGFEKIVVADGGIVISGDAEQRTAILRLLNTLSRDGLSMCDDGIVSYRSLDSLYYSPKFGVTLPTSFWRHSGTNLIRELINSEHNTLIFEGFYPSAFDVHRNGAENLSRHLGFDVTGFDSVVEIVTDPLWGIGLRGDTNHHIHLGHELIHVYGHIIDTVPRRESITVGTGNGPFRYINGRRITENELRREHGLPLHPIMGR
jgi:hypothetical protein